MLKLGAYLHFNHPQTLREISSSWDLCLSGPALSIVIPANNLKAIVPYANVRGAVLISRSRLFRGFSIAFFLVILPFRFNS